MFDIFAREKVITICMFSLMVLSVLLKIVLSYLYYRMIKDTDNMSTTTNKILKQCKLKFSNCYQLNQGVANIPVFVDKFLNRLSLGHFSFETLYHMSGQMMLLGVATAGIGICKAIVEGRILGEILPYYIVCFLGLYIYFSISAMVDIRGKRRILKINLIDYLENHLSFRIEVTEKDVEMLYGKEKSSRAQRKLKEVAKKTVELMPIVQRQAADESNPAYDAETAIDGKTQTPLVDELRREVKKVTDQSTNNTVYPTFTKEQENELEELLKEFLAT